MTDTASAASSDLYVCRTGFELALWEEARSRGLAGSSDPRVLEGAVLLPAPESARSPRLIFERQRLERCFLIPSSQLKPLSVTTVRQILGRLEDTNEPWCLHAFCIPEGEAAPLARRIGGVTKALLRVAREHAPFLMARYRGEGDVNDAGMVLQLALTAEGAWVSVGARERMTETRPGGCFRMRMDSAAPSRSFLKIEEVFERMGDAPRKGEVVVDLGAAPGGWSYACLRRGARVIAVDRGPLKLPPDAASEIEHLRENGLTFSPSPRLLPVDWLLCDMLVSPGTALGILKRWLGRSWMRRFVVNMKLPQERPYRSIQDLEAYLASRRGLTWKILQLYHDRREVSAWGWLEAGDSGGAREQTKHRSRPEVPRRT